MARMKRTRGPAVPRTGVAVRYCFPDDQLPHVPENNRAPTQIPLSAPVPRTGDVVYLSSTSAWIVTTVIHEWRSPTDLIIEVWMDHLGGSRSSRTAQQLLQ